MAANPNDVYSNEDIALFVELDKNTKKMRDAAFNLAGLLSETDGKSKELELVIIALAKLASADIKNLDDALNNFKKAFAYLSFKTPAGIFGSNITAEQYPPLFSEYNNLMSEITAVATKAVELNQQSRGENV